MSDQDANLSGVRLTVETPRHAGGGRSAGDDQQKVAAIGWRKIPRSTARTAKQGIRRCIMQRLIVKARLPTMDAVERKRNRDMADTMSTSGRLPATRDVRCCVDVLRLDFVFDKKTVKVHAKWRGPETKARGMLIMPPRRRGRMLRFLHGRQMSVKKLLVKKSRRTRTSCIRIRRMQSRNYAAEDAADCVEEAQVL